jgi:hypothetical protein
MVAHLCLMHLSLVAEVTFVQGTGIRPSYVPSKVDTVLFQGKCAALPSKTPVCAQTSSWPAEYGGISAQARGSTCSKQSQFALEDSFGQVSRLTSLQHETTAHDLTLTGPATHNMPGEHPRQSQYTSSFC